MDTVEPLSIISEGTVERNSICGKTIKLKRNEMHQKHKKATENENFKFYTCTNRSKTNGSLFVTCVEVAF
jgi:hypothetical protein